MGLDHRSLTLPLLSTINHPMLPHPPPFSLHSDLLISLVPLPEMFLFSFIAISFLMKKNWLTLLAVVQVVVVPHGE